MNRERVFSVFVSICLALSLVFIGALYLDSNKLHTGGVMVFKLTAIYGDDLIGEEVEFQETVFEGFMTYVKFTVQPNRSYLLYDPILEQYNLTDMLFTVNETTTRYQAVQICDEKYFGLAYYKPEIDFGESHWQIAIFLNATRHYQ